MNDNLKDLAEAVNMNAERARTAYNIFRGSYKASNVPHWQDLPVWTRDALVSVYSAGNCKRCVRVTECLKQLSDGLAFALPSDNVQSSLTNERITK